MSPKDKKFFTGFIIACVICIVLVKLVFLGGTSKTSAVESIISENSGLNNISVFSYENKDENKVCAFNYTDESGKEGLGLAILGNNNRGSYDVDSILYSTDESVIVNSSAVVDGIDCAVVAVTDKSEAAKVVVSAKDTTTGADVKLTKRIEPPKITFVPYSDSTQAQSVSNVKVYNSTDEVIVDIDCETEQKDVIAEQ